MRLNRRQAKRYALAAAALAGALWSLAPDDPALATLPIGVLTVTSSLASLGSLSSRADNPGLSLGTLTITDTLEAATSTAWTVSVAASDCNPTATTLGLAQFNHLVSSNVTVGSSHLTFTPGAILLVAGLGTHEVTAQSGTTTTFGAAGSGGFSSPVTIATGPTGPTTLDNNGQWTQTATLDVNLTTATTIPGAYSCTLQYTITG